jgi:D-glycero-D-manno-heptose 1,7-bisphosphate phosphatase
MRRAGAVTLARDLPACELPLPHETADVTQPIPTAFLDRDGVLNIDRGFVFRPHELEFVEGAAAAVRLLNEAGYRVVVVTNQSGVARGLYDEIALRSFHEYMQAELSLHGARIDAFYHCPHHPEGNVAEFAIECDCRKPKAGLLEQAVREQPAERSRSFLIGDREADMAAAAAFGVRGILFDHRSQSLLSVVRNAIEDLAA